ncbi:uncharacterized protein LOC129600130 isoform X1 [Paramacrobiotus metropolitanus]|uniref:uncharacterized protein LOC129600130 isoform X1 n=1 Tax=Paramacrobiotus metropolitanus TaxID=2943436 RepID=UPI002445821D|nr:uncharacterized protein LOC129600130 isoform X1 [Paramacrobiotus metropolitanus]
MDNIQTHMEADCGEYYRICNHLANGVVADHELDDVLTVSVNENAPYSYESPPGSLCFCGFAITVLKDLASEVGLRLFLIPDRNRPEFNTSEIGAPVDVAQGRADISVCPFTFPPLRILEYDVIPLHFMRKYHVGVHKFHIVHSDAVSVLEGLAYSFSLSTWMGIGIISMLFYVMLSGDKFLTYRTRRSSSFCYKILVSCSEALYDLFCVAFSGDFHMTGTTVLTYRILQLIYVPWTMLMFAIITTSLTATLSVSTFTFPFRRAEEMFHSDFKLLAREQPPDQSSESIIAETWRDKTVFIPYSLPDSTLINGAINTSQQTAILCPFDEIPTCTNNGIVPVFSWGVSRWVSILQSKKDQPFMGGMKQKMLMLLQTGIPKHLMEIHKIFTYKNKVNAQSLSFAGASVHLRSVFAERPLTVRKLEKTWTGFLFLISLTVIIFLFEVCLKYYIFQVYSHQN